MATNIVATYRQQAPKTFDLLDRMNLLIDVLAGKVSLAVLKGEDEEADLGMLKALRGLVPTLTYQVHQGRELDAEFLKELREKLDHAAKLAEIRL